MSKRSGRRWVKGAAAFTFVAATSWGSQSLAASTDTTTADTGTGDTTDSTEGEVPELPADFDTEGLEIGQVLYSSNSSQVALGKNIEQYAESLGMSVRTVYGDIDPTKQANAINDFVSAGVDGILFQPVDPAAAIVPIEQAQQAGIPITTWAIKPADEVTTPFLELNEYQTAYDAGVKAGEAAREIWDAPPLIVAIDIPTVPLCSELRVQGFVDGAMSVDPEAEVVARPDGGGDRETATNVMEDVIQSGDDFNIVTGCNGEMALGALAALEAAGRGQAVDKVPTTEYIYTIDGTPPEIEELLDPSSPVMETMMLTLRKNAELWVNILVQMMAGEIDMTEPYLAATGSQNIPPDCEVVTKILVEEYFAEEPAACQDA